MNATDSSRARRQTSPEVITFYSYKGGTGRSMLLANVGWQLAAAGMRVLLIDWDLEAPGLHRYFKPFLGDDPELRNQDGVIEWINDYWDARLDRPDSTVEAVVREVADPRHYVRRLETGSLLSGGIDLLCSGRQDSNYAKAVADFDWTRLFEKLHGELFIAAAKAILTGPGGYDYVLVDSRTGVSDTSGFCTVLLADTLVVCFTYNNQSVIGASQIARDIKHQAEQRRRAALEAGEALRFRLFAVPSRVDDMDPDRLDMRQKHAWSAFSDLLTDVPVDQQAAYWVNVQIRYQGTFSYEEVLAACVNRPGDPQTVLGAVTQLTRMLTDGAFVDAPALGDDQRRELREQFGSMASLAGAALTQSAWDLFVERVPEPAARESLLQSCFPLLVQLFTVSQTPSVGGNRFEIVRGSVLESDLTADERRMAERLTSLGVTQRRITDDRDRGLMVADESIYSCWLALAQRLQENMDFLGVRERVRQARSTWDAGGRSIASLRALQGELSPAYLDDEQRAWIGRSNLQLVQAVQELRAIDNAQRESKERADRLEAKLASQNDEMLAQMRAAEEQRSRMDVEMSAQAQQFLAETRRAEGNAIRLRAVAAGALIVIVGLGVFGYNATLEANRAAAEVKQSMQQLAAIEARQAEVEQLRKLESAMNYYGIGNQLVVKAGRPVASNYDNYDESLKSAIAAFNQAILANPKLAEAYRARALARGNQRETDRDEVEELQDWASYYDLVPSLRGRSQLVLAAMEVLTPDVALISKQLAQLVQDANVKPQPDASPSRVAAMLDAKLSVLPTSLQSEGKKTVEALRAIATTKPRAGAESKSVEKRPSAQ